VVFYNNLNVAGITTLTSSLDVSGATTIGSSLDITGATSIGSNLSVQGASILNTTLEVFGVSTFQDIATFNNGMILPENYILNVKDFKIYQSERNINFNGSTIHNGIIDFSLGNTDNTSYFQIKNNQESSKFIVYGSGQIVMNSNNISIGSVNYIFPPDNGSSNQYLKTDGAGILSWASIPSVSSSSLDDLADVIITIPQNNHLLHYSGGSWVNTNTLTLSSLTVDNTIRLNNITYTFPSSQTSNYYLKTDGAGVLSWASVSGGGASSLDDLTDVIIAVPQANHVLKYNGSNWINTDTLSLSS